MKTPKTECNCKEISCLKECKRYHTHKVFSCELCTSNTVTDWEKELALNWEKIVTNEGTLKSFIRLKLEQVRRDTVDRIEEQLRIQLEIAKARLKEYGRDEYQGEIDGLQDAIRKLSSSNTK